MTFHAKYKDHTVDQLKTAHAAIQLQIDGLKDDDGRIADSKALGRLLDEADYLRDSVRAATPSTPASGIEVAGLARNGGSNPLGKRLFFPGEPRDYNAMFNPTGRPLDDGGFADLEDFQRAIVRAGQGYPDSRLTAMESRRHVRGMTEGVPSEGGFLVPERLTSMIFADVLEQSVILPRCVVRPMSAPEEKIPAWTIGDHSANLYGGITASWTAEGGTISAAEPEVRQIRLVAKKLTELAIPSGELVQDVPNFDGDLSAAMVAAMRWFIDYYLVRGSGAGQPLGVLNSPCRVQVSKETGQAADTICYANLKKMYARQRNKGAAVWLANHDTIPELLEITIPVGTGGNHVPVMREGDSGFSIFNRPVVFTEKAPTLGDQDDISFVDLSQYLVGMLGNIQIAKSIHVHFTTDRTAYRFISRLDAQSMWGEALTPKSGATLSPVVGLQAR